MDGLTEGRIVHYVTREGEHQAAIIARVFDRDAGLVNLAVLHDGGSWYSATSVSYAESKPHEKSVSNTWHWVEKS